MKRHILQKTVCLLLLLALSVPSLLFLVSCNQGTTPPPYEVKIYALSRPSRNDRYPMLYKFPRFNEYNHPFTTTEEQLIDWVGGFPTETVGKEEGASETLEIRIGENTYQGSYTETTRRGMFVFDRYLLLSSEGLEYEACVQRNTGRIYSFEFLPTAEPPSTEEEALALGLELLQTVCGTTFSAEALQHTWSYYPDDNCIRLSFSFPMTKSRVIEIDFFNDKRNEHYGDWKVYVSPLIDIYAENWPTEEKLHASIQAKLEELYRDPLARGSIAIQNFTYEIIGAPNLIENGALLLSVKSQVTWSSLPRGEIYPSKEAFDEANASEIWTYPTQEEWDASIEMTDRISFYVLVPLAEGEQ